MHEHLNLPKDATQSQNQAVKAVIQMGKPRQESEGLEFMPNLAAPSLQSFLLELWHPP